MAPFVEACENAACGLGPHIKNPLFSCPVQLGYNLFESCAAAAAEAFHDEVL